MVKLWKIGWNRIEKFGMGKYKIGLRTNMKNSSKVIRIANACFPFLKFCHLLLKHRRRRTSDSYSFSAATATSRKNSKKSRGRSNTKKRTTPKYELLAKKKPSLLSSFCHLENSVEAPMKTVPQSSFAKKKIMEFLVWHAALDGCSLHGDPHHSPPLPRHCHCALQSDNTWLGLVAHLYISATSILITLAAFLLRGLLLLPLFL